MDTKDTLQYLSLSNGKKLAYRHLIGSEPAPTIVFCGGYRSDMTGTKASFLTDFCEKEGLSLLRFDYSGHGASDGDFKDGDIAEWADDALAVINATVKGDIMLIGSSMGGWIALLLARELGDRIKGFIGIAAAPDFTRHVWEIELTDKDRTLCAQQGYIDTPDGDTLTYKLLQTNAQHLIFDKPLSLPCPVILLHGKRDTVVPYQIAQKLSQHITSPTPPEVIIIEDGDHRLARDKDLNLLALQVKKIL